MTFLGFSKVLSRGVVGVVGLSAIALFGVPQSAKAADIVKGFDQFKTLGDNNTFVVLPGIGQVFLKGVPILADYDTDTILERLEDCTFVKGSCTVPLQIHTLNVASINPVDLSAYGLGTSQVFIGLNGAQTLGSITIDQSGDWTAIVPVNAVAKFPDGKPIALPTPPGGSVTFSATLNGEGTYTSNDPFDPIGKFKGPTDLEFPTFPQEQHEVARATNPIPLPVPEPSNTAAIAVLGLGSLVTGIKRKGNLKQK